LKKIPTLRRKRSGWGTRKGKSRFFVAWLLPSPKMLRAGGMTISFYRAHKQERSGRDKAHRLKPVPLKARSRFLVALRPSARHSGQADGRGEPRPYKSKGVQGEMTSARRLLKKIPTLRRERSGWGTRKGKGEGRFPNVRRCHERELQRPHVSPAEIAGRDVSYKGPAKNWPDAALVRDDQEKSK